MCPSPRPGCTGFLQHHQPGHRAQVQAPLTLRPSCHLDQETLSPSLHIRESHSERKDGITPPPAQRLGAGDNHSPHLRDTHSHPDLGRGRIPGIPRGGVLGKSSDPVQHRAGPFPPSCRTPSPLAWLHGVSVACSLVPESHPVRATRSHNRGSLLRTRRAPLWPTGRTGSAPQTFSGIILCNFLVSPQRQARGEQGRGSVGWSVGTQDAPAHPSPHSMGPPPGSVQSPSVERAAGTRGHITSPNAAEPGRCLEVKGTQGQAGAEAAVCVRSILGLASQGLR